MFWLQVLIISRLKSRRAKITFCQLKLTFFYNGFSLILYFIILQTFGHISAAHVNPAVSLGAIIVQQITWKQLPGYVVPQLLGSLTGSALFKVSPIY